MMKRILIANRGEIAVRIIKACREVGFVSIVPYSEADKNSLHVRISDEAYPLKGNSVSETYLNQNAIIKIAKKYNVDAIHPGYGLLSENPNFIRLIEKEGIIFIGPSSEAVKLMGNKTSARKLMIQHDVPVVPGSEDVIATISEAETLIKNIGLPVMIKAVAGGGGKGMRKVESLDTLENDFNRARSEARNSFSNPDVYIEKFIDNPKHIEVQILGDKHGNYVHLFERDCSIQRRHQKVVEESPSTFIDEDVRIKITEAAIKAAMACDYFNAGTIEFLMGTDKQFYFLEMNTRLQVEHPVTEMITGTDLVKEQLKIAQGEKLSLQQSLIKRNGHSIECRVYAEDIENNFAPSIGKIKHHRLPSGPGIRVERGVDVHSDVSVYYDPLLSKVISWGATRIEALERMKRALGEYQIVGVKTNIPFLMWVLKNKNFVDGDFNINFIEKEFSHLLPNKWRESDSDDYEMNVLILAGLLKYKENNLKPTKNTVSDSNMWGAK